MEGVFLVHISREVADQSSHHTGHEDLGFVREAFTKQSRHPKGAIETSARVIETFAAISDQTNLRNMDTATVDTQRIRNPAVLVLLLQTPPAGVVEGATRMVMMGTHLEKANHKL